MLDAAARFTARPSDDEMARLDEAWGMEPSRPTLRSSPALRPEPQQCSGRIDKLRPHHRPWEVLPGPVEGDPVDSYSESTLGTSISIMSPS